MDIILSLAGLVVGLFVLEAGADRFTDAVGAVARRLRASESTVGLLTAGGEWEELVVVLLALLGGSPGLAIGNIIGSCIANLVGSLPLGMFGKCPLKIDRSARVYALVMLAATALASAFLFHGTVTRAAGGVLVGAFVVYLVSVVLVIRHGWLRPPAAEDDDDDDEDNERERGLLRLLVGVALGLAIIAVGAELVVQGAVIIARVVGLSEYAIGATVVAVGTTLPDKAISLIAGQRGQGGIVTANATGSNVFLLTLVLGLSALAGGTNARALSAFSSTDVLILVAVSVTVVALFWRASLHWRTGLGLLAIYAGYLAYALLRGA